MSLALPGRRRRLLLVLLAVTLLLSVRHSFASCSPPEVEVEPRRVAPGDLIVVSGTGWAASCDAPREGGCRSDDRPAAAPVTGIRATLVPAREPQRGSVDLGLVDASEEYTFELHAVVPESTPPGRYRVDVGAGAHVAEPPSWIVVGGFRRGPPA